MREDGKMDIDISGFLTTQTCATVCLTEGIGSPYCFSCFYAFDVEENMIYFKSSPDSYHVKLFDSRKIIAGTILPDKLTTLRVQGIQFQGTLLDKNHPLSEKASKLYHKRYPFALVKSGEIWTIQLHSIKMTDNSKGFGTKIRWEKATKKSVPI